MKKQFLMKGNKFYIFTQEGDKKSVQLHSGKFVKNTQVTATEGNKYYSRLRQLGFKPVTEEQIIGRRR